MRLTCPSCGAVYEVPDDAIPEGGRDVQCTNCGHGWFHRPSGAAPDRAAQSAPYPTRDPDDEPERGAWDAPDDDEEPLDPPPGAGRRPPMDPRLRRVLREEAEREVDARRSERRLRTVEDDPAARPPPARRARWPAPWPARWRAP